MRANLVPNLVPPARGVPPQRRGAGAGARTAARGLSLVELMVGVTIGLFIVAAATMLASTQLGENRRLMLETQLQQDLRASADIITRELRRAGAASAPWSLIASDTQAATYNSMSDVTVTNASPANIQFAYYRRPGEQGPWGFTLQNGVIKTRVPVSMASQDLTDGSVMRVTSFSITPSSEPDLVLPCPKLCPVSNDTSCWPRVAVRTFAMAISAQSVNDPTVTRSIRSEVRVRNDRVQFLNGSPATAACPE